jgi:hypothetical protein
LGGLLLGQKFLDGFFVKLIRLALHNRKCILGAFAQAGSQAVAIYVRNHPGFAIYDFKGSLGAGRNAIPAAITEVFVNFNYFSDNFHDISFLRK